MKSYLNKSLLRYLFSFTLVIALMLGTNLMPKTNVQAAAINVTDDGTTITVNTGAGVVYTIKKSNGAMISCTLNGTQLLDPSRPSSINSGMGAFGNVNVTWKTFSSASQILITCATETLTHYYASKSGDNNIYMATYNTQEPSVGELRYIFRGNGSVLTNVPANSNLRGNDGNAENDDIFHKPDGTTASKFYGNDQAKDLSVRGATGKDVGVFVAYGDRETSSGGPFFRDIQFQSGTNTEIYNYMNSGHNQTEAWRTGLHGPYAYCFTTGQTPNVPDFSWMSNLGLKGYVNSAGRGKVVLNGLKGMDKNYSYTIGFSNSTAQYWTSANANGEAIRSNMLPGTYTMTVYKGELGVYTENVNVTAGGVTTLNSKTITTDPSTTSTIWRLGDWDGTPLEFLNGKNISLMHPSDIRNSSWEPKTFTIGNKASTFPAVQFKGFNKPSTINFNLNSTQAASKHTLKIGITCAYNGGRPTVSINGHALTNPSASSQPMSRSITLGTYRGNNNTYTWNVPTSYFVNGTNTLNTSPISGKEDLTTWLSASYAYDCIELDN